MGSGPVFRVHSTYKGDPSSKSDSVRTLNRGEDDLELREQGTSAQVPTGYDVSVSGGRRGKRNPDSFTGDHGIRTTTVITQRVEDD